MPEIAILYIYSKKLTSMNLQVACFKQGQDTLQKSLRNTGSKYLEPIRASR